MKIREIMTTDVSTAAPDTTLEEIATMMKSEDVGAIPIVDDGELFGLVTDRDIVIRCIAEGHDPSGTRAEDIVTEDLHTIEPDQDADEAAELMGQHQIRRLPVVEEGRLLGMVAIGDIAVKHGDDRASGDTLQEISRGVKRSTGSSRKPSPAAEPAKVRGPQQQGTAGRNQGRAGRMREQGLRNHTDSGSTGRSSSRNAATRGRNIDPGKQGITNRPAGEETKRNARVVPIRAESRSSGRKTSGRKRAS